MRIRPLSRSVRPNYHDRFDVEFWYFRIAATAPDQVQITRVEEEAVAGVLAVYFEGRPAYVLYCDLRHRVDPKAPVPDWTALGHAVARVAAADPAQAYDLGRFLCASMGVAPAYAQSGCRERWEKAVTHFVRRCIYQDRYPQYPGWPGPLWDLALGRTAGKTFQQVCSHWKYSWQSDPSWITSESRFRVRYEALGDETDVRKEHLNRGKRLRRLGVAPKQLHLKRDHRGELYCKVDAIVSITEWRAAGGKAALATGIFAHRRGYFYHSPERVASQIRAVARKTIPAWVGVPDGQKPHLDTPDLALETRLAMSRATIMGARAKFVQNCLRNTTMGGHPLRESLRHLKRNTGAPILRMLHEFGLVHLGERTITARGSALSDRTGTQYLRQTALKRIEEMVNRASALASDPEVRLEIETLFVFGSVLKDVDRVGDVDVGYELRPKGVQEFGAHWEDRELCRRKIKGRSPLLKLHGVTELPDTILNGPRVDLIMDGVVHRRTIPS